MTGSARAHIVQPVILSGGSGTRLWPASRKRWPKQFLSFVAEATMLQATAARVRGQGEDGLTFLAPIVICNAGHCDAALAQLAEAGAPPSAVLLEPMGRNTAPAAGAVSAFVAREAPERLILLLPADHHLPDAAAFQRACAQGAEHAAQGRIVVFGIKPTEPHTGYGYICAASRMGGAAPVESFEEKPNREKAERYLAAGDYHWNAGVFLFRADVMLAELARHEPGARAHAEAALARGSWSPPRLTLDAEAFSRAPDISLDNAVMERTKLGTMAPLAADWSDLGSWTAVWEIAAKDSLGNAASGPVELLDCEGALLRSDGPLIAAVGVKDLVVVVHQGVVLVCPRERAQEVRAIVDRLREAGREELL